MLEELLIQNFQAHVKTRIIFDPEITCIIGPSDSGKSAIIRALKWVCCNVPGGSSFVRHGTKGTTVKLLVDGKTIIRKRSSNDTTNEYLLGKESYKAFGRSIPEPVLNALNIDSISWQGQHDSPYWFSSTAGEVSRQLNTIVDLSIIDGTLSAITRAVNKSATRLEVTKDAEEKAKNNFAALQWVPEYSKEVELLRTIGKEAIDKRKSLSGITELYIEAKKHRTTIQQCSIITSSGSALIQKWENATKIQKSHQVINDLITIAKRSEKAASVEIPETTRITEAIKKHKSASDSSIIINQLVKEVYRLRVTAKANVPDITPMESSIERHKKTKTTLSNLKSLIEDFNKKEKEIATYKMTIELIKKEMPEICPTCNQPLK